MPFRWHKLLPGDCKAVNHHRLPRPSDITGRFAIADGGNFNEIPKPRRISPQHSNEAMRMLTRCAELRISALPILGDDEAFSTKRPIAIYHRVMPGRIRQCHGEEISGRVDGKAW